MAARLRLNRPAIAVESQITVKHFSPSTRVRIAVRGRNFNN
jgi:hypothetical protein